MPRTKGATSKTYELPTLEELSTSVIATREESASLAPKARGVVATERTPLMKQFDTWAQEYYDWWTAAGKPAPFTDACPPRKVYAKDAKQAEAIHMLASAGARFTGHGIRFGTDTPTTDGKITVSFVVVDKIPRKEKATTNVS